MPSAIFNGAELTIQLPSVGSFDAQADLYSAWKRWVQDGDNAKYPSAFGTTGGDSIGGGQTIAPYFFCRNDLGWRIKMPDANGEIIILGNIFPRESTTTLFKQSEGFDAFLRLEVSSKAVVVEVETGTGGGGSLTAEHVADAVWACPAAEIQDSDTVGELISQVLTVNKYIALK